jgi:hypothetical protein
MKTRGKTCRRDQIGYLVDLHVDHRAQHPSNGLSQKTKLSTGQYDARIGHKQEGSVWTIKLLECENTDRQYQQLSSTGITSAPQLQHQNRRKDYTIWVKYSGPLRSEHPTFWCESPADRTCMDVCVFCCKDITGFVHWQSIHERIRAFLSRTWYTRSCCSRPCLVSL